MLEKKSRNYRQYISSRRDGRVYTSSSLRKIRLNFKYAGANPLFPRTARRYGLLETSVLELQISNKVFMTNSFCVGNFKTAYFVLVCVCVFLMKKSNLYFKTANNYCKFNKSCQTFTNPAKDCDLLFPKSCIQTKSIQE
jgi:hypothetical protein